jgi:hypothetical protein
MIEDRAGNVESQQNNQGGRQQNSNQIREHTKYFFHDAAPLRRLGYVSYRRQYLTVEETNIKEVSNNFIIHL